MYGVKYRIFIVPAGLFFYKAVIAPYRFRFICTDQIFVNTYLDLRIREGNDIVQQLFKLINLSTSDIIYLIWISSFKNKPVCADYISYIAEISFDMQFSTVITLEFLYPFFIDTACLHHDGITKLSFCPMPV